MKKISVVRAIKRSGFGSKMGVDMGGGSDKQKATIFVFRIRFVKKYFLKLANAHTSGRAPTHYDSIWSFFLTLASMST